MKHFIYLAILEPGDDLAEIRKEMNSFKLLKNYKSLQMIKFSLDHQISEAEKTWFKSVELEQKFHAIEEE